MLVYRLEYGDASGINTLEFEFDSVALCVAQLLKENALGVDSVMVWRYPDPRGDEDASVIFDWTKGQICAD